MQEVFPGYDFIRNNIAHIDGLVQDYGILFASALEILQSYAESWISPHYLVDRCQSQQGDMQYCI